MNKRQIIAGTAAAILTFGSAAAAVAPVTGTTSCRSQRTGADAYAANQGGRSFSG
jgi:hypothetical protein